MKRWVLGLILNLAIAAAAHGGDKPEEPRSAAGTAFDVQGQLWRAEVKQGQVWVDHSQPLLPGDTPKFSAAVALNANPEKITALAISGGDQIWVAWEDAGAAIYLTVSNDQGASFSPARKVADSGSACAGIALQATPDKQVVAMWRQSFDAGVSDYAIAKLDMQTPINMHRATFGGLHLDACQQPAPALARGGDWGWHMAWFDGGDRAGVFYARMDGDAWVSSPGKRFKQAQAAQPSLLALGECVWLAWKEPNEQESNERGAAINIAASDDGGRSWSSPTVVAQTQGAADDPMLLSHGEQAYVSWNTAAGFKLLLLQ